MVEILFTLRDDAETFNMTRLTIPNKDNISVIKLKFSKFSFKCSTGEI